MNATHCRIGKVRLKDGGTEIHRFRGSHVAEVRHQTRFDALDFANDLAANGCVQGVAVAVVHSGGWTNVNFSRVPSLPNGQLVAAVDLLHRHLIDSWK